MEEEGNAVRKLPYHDYARDKYAALGFKYEIQPIQK